MVDISQLRAALKQYGDHRQHICSIFNAHAAKRGLPIKVSAPDPKGALAAAAVAYYTRGDDDTGVVHDEQAKTSVECLFQLWLDEKRQGLVLGAMQSGKTTTSLTLQWAGPVLYLLTGQRSYPFYLVSNQTNHADQTEFEMQRFLLYYGDLEFSLLNVGDSPIQSIDAVFELSPTLATYRDHVLKDALDDVFTVASFDDIVHRRVHGRHGLQQIAALYRRATGGGYRPLMIIDEPQFGAGDRVVPKEGKALRAPCMLTQIFSRIEAEIGGNRKDHWFVGLSATPFELIDLANVWRVRQYLSPSYSGYNFFGGNTISDNVAVNPPTTKGLTAFATAVKVPFIANVSMRAYRGTEAVFQKHAAKIRYQGTQEEYQADVERSIRQSILAILDQNVAETGPPMGICIRAFNDNRGTEDLLRRLRLPSKKVEVVRYYGTEVTGFSVKRVIAKRKHPDLPYVVFVTNRARMADAFPAQVRYFLDFAEMASNLNALLQGLLGRACGYNKRSVVIMSDANKTIIDAYTDTTGGYVHRTSAHSTVVGGFRRGAPSGMVKLRRDMADKKVTEFFARIDSSIVEAFVPPGTVQLSPPRSRNGEFRTGPVLLIAEKLKLFDYIESKPVREVLFPEIPSGFHVARADDKIEHSRDKEVSLGYALDKAGNCRYTFRRMDSSSVARGGAAGRAKGARDTGQHIEPTIYVEKYHPKTGSVIERDGKGDDRGGSWRACMVTFPLREPVREIQWGNLAFPTMLSPYDDLMTDEEQEQRDMPQRRAGRGG